MKAVVLEKNGFRLDSAYPMPIRGKKEVLIRINLAGICGTDLELSKGYMGFRGIPGHEFVGTVIDADSEDLMDKRVVGEINIGCHECEFCRIGLQRHCPSRKVLGIVGTDGVFAEYSLLPESNILLVPSVLSDREAVFTEPLAAALEIQEQIGFSGREQVLVLGDGTLGILCAGTLSIIGCTVRLLGHHPSKLNTAQMLFPNLDAQIETDLRPKRLYDVVVDATGHPDGLGKAVQWVKPRGIVVVKTTCEKERSISFNDIVIHEIKVIGSRCGRLSEALELLQKKKFKPDLLISDIFPLDSFRKAFQRAMEGTSLKVLFSMEG